MTIKEISAIAAQMNISPLPKKKLDLIRLIQRTEGNNDCYATQYSHACGQAQCAWREDCLKADQ